MKNNPGQVPAEPDSRFEWLDRALGRLGPRQMEVAELLMGSDLSLADIAKRLGISRGGVYAIRKVIAQRLAAARSDARFATWAEGFR